MSKLYYALSLWTDETRLHDPNLYLPALPIHYEPNLLAKIFSKQTELWTQFVDLTLLSEHIDSITKHDSVQLSRKKSNASNVYQSHSLLDYFFTQEDRMVLSSPSLAELNIKIGCALSEKFGSSLDNLLRIELPSNSATAHAYPVSSSHREQIQLIVNISEHLIRNIFKYNKEIVNNTLNHMLKLDDKLVSKLITNLWSNEMCEKYVQVPCSSLINPMHQCVRPAMIKFVYELATKRDQYRHEIKENRFNYEKLLSTFTDSNSSKRHHSGENSFSYDSLNIYIF